MSDDNLKKSANYWHSMRSNGHRVGLRLHWDREVQLKEMKQYVRPLNEVGRTVLMDSRLISCALVIAIVLALAGIAILIFFNASPLGVIIGLLLLICGPIGAYLLYLNRKVHRRRIVKYSLVSQAVERYFHPEVYLAQKKLPDLFIREASLVDDEWKSAEVSDYFAGIWKSLPFQFGDLTITGSLPGSRQSAILFSGQIFIIELANEVPVPILIREREELLSPEMYEARKESPRFFLTGNEQFDRQFALSFGEEKRASGFEDTGENTQDEIRAKIHETVDSMVQDILDADNYASSRTSIRLIHKRMYLAIENNRDTFELMKEDERHVNLDLLQKRFDEEAEHMTTYLDIMTRSGSIFNKAAAAQETETAEARDAEK